MLKFGSKKNLCNENKCTIRLLDDNEIIECEFQSYHKGRYLLDYVFNHLNLIETDYFGLRYVDSNKQRHWIDPNRNILRQMKGVYPLTVCFRVKFYPCEPSQLLEEVSRYQLFLQLLRDLLHGRLYCQQNDSAYLAALLLQAELGDHANQPEGYVQQCQLLVRQTPKIEEKIEELHRTLAGTTTTQAETLFLKKSASLDTYGVDPYPVKDQKGVQIYLGLSHSGLLTFQGSRKTQHFRWSEVQRLNYEGKMFIAHVTIVETKHTVGFKCPSATACKHLWRAAVEQRLFYTLPSSGKKGVVVTGGSFFSRGTRFRYQGRCEREVILDSTGIMREAPRVRRTPHLLPRSSSLPTTPPHQHQPPNADMEEGAEAHRRLPYIDRSTSLDEEVLCGGSSPAPPLSRAGSRGVSYCPESSLPPLLEPEATSEALDNEDMNGQCQAEELRPTWSHTACSCSHSLELPHPDRASSSALSSHYCSTTGSLPRHPSLYTPRLPHGSDLFDSSALGSTSPVFVHDHLNASPKTTPLISVGSETLQDHSSTLPHRNRMHREPSEAPTQRLASSVSSFSSSSTSLSHHRAGASPAAGMDAFLPQGSSPPLSLHCMPGQSNKHQYSHQHYSPQQQYLLPPHSQYPINGTNSSHQQPLYQRSLSLDHQRYNQSQATTRPVRSQFVFPFGIRRNSVFAFLRVFVRTLVLVLLLLFVAVVFLLELRPSSGLLDALRSRPEIVLLRLHYYQPFKAALFRWSRISRDADQGVG